MRFALVVLIALAATGCSSKLAVSHDGRAVLDDAYDGKLDRNWSCGSLRAAYRRLPQDPPAYSAIPSLIAASAGKTCGAAVTQVRVGDSRAKVTAALGPPDRTPRCWLYRWPTDRDNPSDGARICFAAGRVARVQIAVHG